MCFGKTWSVVSATACLTTAVLAVLGGAPLRMIAFIVFLAVKELLQLGLYYSLQKDGVCTAMNTTLTAASWLHISMQPFFVLLLISAFSKNPRAYDVPLWLCVVFAVFNSMRLAQLRPGGAASATWYPCSLTDPSVTMCRESTCSIRGKYHVAYGFQLSSSDANTYTPSLFAYMLLSFAVPFVVGDWWIASISALVAVASSAFARHDVGEAAALWCLNSFWFCLLVVWHVATKLRAGNGRAPGFSRIHPGGDRVPVTISSAGRGRRQRGSGST